MIRTYGIEWFLVLYVRDTIVLYPLVQDKLQAQVHVKLLF